MLDRMKKIGVKNVAELHRKMTARGLRVSQVEIGHLLNLKRGALRSSGAWRPLALKLASFFECLPEDLFPESLRELELASNKRDLELSKPEIQWIISQKPATPDLLLERRESREVLANIMRSVLNSREEVILNMRFGMGEFEREHTLKEVGAKLGVTPNRIRELEARALRKLMHPRALRRLREAVEDLKIFEC